MWERAFGKPKGQKHNAKTTRSEVEALRKPKSKITSKNAKFHPSPKTTHKGRKRAQDEREDKHHTWYNDQNGDV